MKQHPSPRLNSFFGRLLIRRFSVRPRGESPIQQIEDALVIAAGLKNCGQDSGSAGNLALVGKGRLELPRLSAHDPKSCSSTSSDTSPAGDAILSHSGSDAASDDPNHQPNLEATSGLNARLDRLLLGGRQSLKPGGHDLIVGRRSRQEPDNTGKSVHARKYVLQICVQALSLEEAQLHCGNGWEVGIGNQMGHGDAYQCVSWWRGSSGTAGVGKELCQGSTGLGNWGATFSAKSRKLRSAASYGMAPSRK